MQIVYTRLPAETERYTQELLHDGPACKISLMQRGLDATPLRLGEVQLEPGGAVMWFVFPGRSYEVAAVHGPDGRMQGYYTNLIRPPTLETGVWQITDLYLDVWQPAGEAPRLLDEDDLARAVADGKLGSEEAGRIRAEADAILRAGRARRWPPAIVTRNGLDAVPSLRFRRDAPGTYFANMVAGRLIAFGIYALGAVSLISMAFAALSGAFLPGPSAARTAWLASIGIMGLLLLVLAMLGRLPATRRPRPEEAVTERILFVGAVVSAFAVLLYPDGRLWRAALVGIYVTLAVFLSIFAVSRAWHDRRVPALALTGLIVCAAALIVLL